MLNGWIKLTQSMFILWYVEKDEFTATHKPCNKDINVAHIGFRALKQHSEKGTYWIYCSIGRHMIQNKHEMSKN